MLPGGPCNRHQSEQYDYNKSTTNKAILNWSVCPARRYEPSVGRVAVNNTSQKSTMSEGGLRRT